MSHTIMAWAAISEEYGLNINTLFTKETDAVEWAEGIDAKVVPVVVSTESLADELLEALEALIDEQNGPPLLTRETQWNEAMKQARAAIKKARGEA